MEDEAVRRAVEERDALGQALGIYPPPRLFVPGSGLSRAEAPAPVPDADRPAALERFDGLCDVLPGYIAREHREAAAKKGRRRHVQSLARERVSALRNLLWRVSHFGDALTADRAVERWETEQDAAPAVGTEDSAEARGDVPASVSLNDWKPRTVEYLDAALGLVGSPFDTAAAYFRAIATAAPMPSGVPPDWRAVWVQFARSGLFKTGDGVTEARARIEDAALALKAGEQDRA